MLELICYNFMSKTSLHCLDLSDDEYKHLGVNRKNKNDFNIETIKKNDLIFVKTDFIVSGYFSEQILPKIKTPFILISGISDYNIDVNDYYKDILKNKYLIKWYTTNPPKKDIKKIEFIPIGFQETERLTDNELNILKYYYQKNINFESKLNRIYVPIHANTNDNRKNIIDKLRKYDFVDIETKRLSLEEYLNKISRYKYVISLSGNGWDCHRNYESLLVSSVPILDNDAIIYHLNKMNIPVFDINNINENMFKIKYDFTNTKSFLSQDYHFDRFKKYVFKAHFVTFADSRLKISLDRIQKQAQDMNYYDNITIYNETGLDNNFIDHFKDKMIFGSRGFGYWCWKPQIILQELYKMNDNDILQYSDAGCHINKNGYEKLIEYFNIANDSGILAFQSRSKSATPNDIKGHFLPEYQWTKGDILDYFNVRNNIDILKTGQIGSGIIFIKKCEKSIKIIQEWLKSYYYDYSLADDSLSKAQNIDGFIENRHDQSILSILCKINNIPTLSVCEYFPVACMSTEKWMGFYDADITVEDYSNWASLEKSPVIAKRDLRLNI